MADISLKDAQVVWNLYEAEAEPGDPPLKVVARDAGGDDDRYMSSWGACNMEFNEASDEQRVAMLFAKFAALTVEHGIAPQAVHDALMSIPEYRRGLADVGGLDPALVGGDADE